MNRVSSKLNDEEKGEENIENTEENAINSKNQNFNFSLMNISKYKKYTLNQNQNEKNDENNFEKNQTKINNNIINLESLGNEKIEEEELLKKINIYKNFDKHQIFFGSNEKNINQFPRNLESNIAIEEIFIRQKDQIQKMKEKNEQYKYNSSLKPKESIKNAKTYKNRINLKKNLEYSFQRKNYSNSDNNNISSQKLYYEINKRKSLKETCLFLTLDNPQFFEISYFQKNSNFNSKRNEDEFENESEIIPIINNTWENVTEFKKIDNYIEFNNIALRTLNEVNYNTNGVEINIDFSLIGESELWIFSRCFVNKDFNDSDIFDVFSMNIEPNVMFNKYSSLIKIIKEKNCNKCFISFGTFYEDERDDNKIKYGTFLKRQLIDYSQYNDLNLNNSNTIYYYLENDLLDIKAIIVDLGNDIIDAKISLNNNKKFNHIEGKFYLPTIKRSKILFCGFGQSIQVRKLRINNIDKFEETVNDEINKKSCTCCNIF